jgi:hypothetical protein
MGQILTLWLVRVATGLYVLAVAAWLMRRDRLGRVAWTVGCVFFLAHVACAFQFYHHWSHTAAYIATERVSGWGASLYINYLFIAIWISDVIWWWRPRAVRVAIHIFFAFMFFNAAVVFATGPIRWFGAAATVLLIALNIIRTRTAPGRLPLA